MKKLFLSLFAILSFAKMAHAEPADWNYIPITSYTDVATPGTILFTSAPVQFVSLTISSPSPNGYIVIYRSTTPVFTADIATQTYIGNDYLAFNSGPTEIDMHEMKNTSFTYISKVGTAKVTMYLRCSPPAKTRQGLCPGLPWNGSMGTKIEYQ